MGQPKEKTVNKVSDDLTRLAQLHESRNSEYGNAYKKHGAVMLALFPEGLNISSEGDQARLGVLNILVGKLVRYAGAFPNRGHDDSLDDLAVYAMMLKELDQEKRAAPTLAKIELSSTMSQETAERLARGGPVMGGSK